MLEPHSSCLKHASHQLSCVLQIRLLHMGVNIAHGGDVRPPADDLHGLLIHAAAAAERGECVPEAVRRRAVHVDLRLDALPGALHGGRGHVVLHHIFAVVFFVG